MCGLAQDGDGIIYDMAAEGAWLADIYTYEKAQTSAQSTLGAPLIRRHTSRPSKSPGRLKSSRMASGRSRVGDSIARRAIEYAANHVARPRRQPSNSLSYFSGVVS
jgi:hypothetical protein